MGTSYTSDAARRSERGRKMAYTEKNFKTKKALKEAMKTGEVVRVYQPGPFGQSVQDGRVTLEGPHYPAAHSWYASGEVKDGVLLKVS